MDHKDSRLGEITSIASLTVSILGMLSAVLNDRNPAYLLTISIGAVCLLLALLSFKTKRFLAYVSIGLALLLILLVVPRRPVPTDDDDSVNSAPATPVGTTVQVDTSPSTESKSDNPYVLPGIIKKFGHYEQDNKDLNGPEEIEWMALTQENDEVLVISVLGLNALPYDQAKDASDWENSSIRGWLNGKFYQTVFSDEEKDGIVSKEIVQHKNKDYPACAQGEVTTDCVFLLSAEEYTEYLYNNGNIDADYRNGTPSPYLHTKIQSELSNDKYAWWWLRTSSRYNTTACSVTGYGVLDYGYRDINSGKGMVRPAMWVKADFFDKLQD